MYEVVTSVLELGSVQSYNVRDVVVTVFYVTGGGGGVVMIIPRI